MPPTTERCRFHTTRPLPTLLQAAQAGNPTRYRQCKNRATTVLKIMRHSLTGDYEREVPACGLHKRLHEERGLLP